MGLSPGARLGPYEIAELVGAGGMGEVYRARDVRLGRDVAVKVLPESVRNDPERLRRFEQEARAAGALEHPNILAVHDFDTGGAVPYLVAELLEGRSLRDVLDGGRLDLRRALHFAAQIARGLAAAHAKNIVHRDLKPENLFVLADERVKILDFGLAKALAAPEPPGATVSGDADTRNALLTRDGAMLGSAGYMAPEQVNGKPADHRADVFAFGAVLHELLTGQRAFLGATVVERAYATLHDQPRGLATIEAECSPLLERVVRRCLEKDPARRFQSTQDLLFQLESLDPRELRPVTGDLPRVAAAAAPVATAVRRWPAMAAAVVVSLASGAIGYAVLMDSARKDTRLAAFAELQRAFPGAGAPGGVALEGLPTPGFGEQEPAHFQRVTFRRGDLQPARFSPDGRTVIHTGFFNGEPPRVYATQPGVPEGRALTEPATTLLAVSSQGEMAIAIWPKEYKGTPILARASLSGGPPRQLAEGAFAADFSPDGKELAALVREKAKDRLEYPLGHVLLEGPAERFGEELRVSPDGQSIAFFSYPVPKDDRGTVELVDVHGKRRTLSGPWYSLRGLAWSPDGREVWFGASERGTHYKIRAVSLDGHDRVVLEQAGPVRPQDIAPDGRVLVTSDRRASYAYLTTLDATAPVKDVSWLDYTVIMGISDDGKKIVFNEIAESAVNESLAYFRDLDAPTEPVRIGEGQVWAISPDGRWVLTSPKAPYDRLVLTPTGPGKPRELPRGAIRNVTSAELYAEGKSVLIQGEDADGEWHLWRQSIDHGEPVTIGPPGYRLAMRRPSPDGKQVLVTQPDHVLRRLDLVTGKLEPFTQVPKSWWPIDWTADGKGLFVRDWAVSLGSTKVARLDLATGAVEVLRELHAPDPVGAMGINTLILARDGHTLVYGVAQRLGELYVAEGLR